MFRDRFVKPAELLVKRVRRPFERRRYNRELKPFRDQGLQVVHFLHVRKAGGSAVKNALSTIAVEEQGVHFELHPHRFSLRDVPVGDKAFFFLRDPLTRFVSGFWSRYRMGRPKNDIPWTWQESQAFELFHTPNALARALSADTPELRSKAVKAMRGIRHVNSSYSDWLISAEYLEKRRDDILMVGRLESLNNDFERLKSLLNLQCDLALPRDGVKAHRSPGGEDKHLDAEAERNIREWYAADYEFIELCRRLGFFS
jgi:hypothetical protein